MWETYLTYLEDWQARIVGREGDFSATAQGHTRPMKVSSQNVLKSKRPRVRWSKRPRVLKSKRPQVKTSSSQNVLVSAGQNVLVSAGQNVLVFSSQNVLVSVGQNVLVFTNFYIFNAVLLKGGRLFTIWAFVVSLLLSSSTKRCFGLRLWTISDKT